MNTMSTGEMIFIYFLAVVLILISILAIPNLFVSKKKEPSGAFKKLILYQGWFGLLVCILGVAGFVWFALKIDVLWVTMILCCAGLAFLGFLLSNNLIYRYFLSNKGKDEGTESEKDEESAKKEESQHKTLTSIMPLQGKIAILGLLLGILGVMAAVMYAS